MLNTMSLLAASLFAGPTGSALLAKATCTLNGKDVPCGELGRSIAQWGLFGLVILIVIAVVGIFVFIFWLKMLIHAIKQNIDYKPVWILVILLTGIIGAVVYYFAVKKHMPTQSTPPANIPPAGMPPAH